MDASTLTFRERLLAGLVAQSEENHYYIGRIQFHRFKDGWSYGPSTNEMYNERRFPTAIDAVFAAFPTEDSLTSAMEGS